MKNIFKIILQITILSITYPLTSYPCQNNIVQQVIIENNEFVSKIDRYMHRFDTIEQKYNVDHLYMIKISNMVSKTCKQYNIAPDYILALIAVESNFKPNAKSFLGDKYGKGLCQVSNIVLKEYNMHNTVKYSESELYNETINIEVACWYYNRLRTHYCLNGLDSIMSAYNRGVKGGYASTYVTKIRQNLKLLSYNT